MVALSWFEFSWYLSLVSILSLLFHGFQHTHLSITVTHFGTNLRRKWLASDLQVIPHRQESCIMWVAILLMWVTVLLMWIAVLLMWVAVLLVWVAVLLVWVVVLLVWVTVLLVWVSALPLSLLKWHSRRFLLCKSV